MKYLVLTILMINTALAADDLQINLKFADHLNVTRVEAIYQSNKNVPGCGKFDMGSRRAKFKYEDSEPTESFSIPKEIKTGFFPFSCTYKLTGIGVYAVNPDSGYENPYFDKVVINKYNSKYYGESEIADTFVLACQNGTNFGCTLTDSLISIESDTLSIILN